LEFNDGGGNCSLQLLSNAPGSLSLFWFAAAATSCLISGWASCASTHVVAVKISTWLALAIFTRPTSQVCFRASSWI